MIVNKQFILYLSSFFSRVDNVDCIQYIKLISSLVIFGIINVGIFFLIVIMTGDYLTNIFFKYTYLVCTSRYRFI